MFIGAGEKVYPGMIIGEHSRGRDLDVNPLKTKQLTNVRASGTDEAVVLTTPIRMTLEKAIAYIAEDELVEVTPQSIRLRKRHLGPWRWSDGWVKCSPSANGAAYGASCSRTPPHKVELAARLHGPTHPNYELPLCATSS